MTSQQPPPYSAKDHHHPRASSTRNLIRQYFRRADQTFGLYWKQAKNSPYGRRARQIFISWRLAQVFSFPNLLTYLWMFLVYWGERSTFRHHIDACDWSNWEQWPSDASPHHLIFVADPQLVDPHTYPGRPWPLSTATVKYTDLYLTRAFSLMQHELYPDTVIFLGDLFDGGREWSTSSSESPEEQWRQYGEAYWLREFDRFGQIFFTHWKDAGIKARHGQSGRRIITNLPGNHDLGFGAGIQKPVRNRFNAYFGDGNGVNVFGNHTFISVDTVSLSARGIQGADPEIWTTTEGFLSQVRDAKRRAVGNELRAQEGRTPTGRFVHKVTDYDITYPTLKSDDVTEFPTVLLSHVPLYRAEGTPCGPLRERWPPSRENWPAASGTKVPEHGPVRDDRNAIRVAAGYQYQNVLTAEISQDITKRIGDTSYAFSGDDHDYCEVVHRSYPSGGGGIREITVKSLSWAMGIRHPGFVMVSLWNPVNSMGKSLGNSDEPTMQTHLCLLPDQLGIFIRYAVWAFISIVVLGLRAAIVGYGYLQPTYPDRRTPILPLSRDSSPATSTRRPRADTLGETETFHSIMSDKQNGNVSARSAAQRNRSKSPSLGGYGLPASATTQQPGNQGNGYGDHYPEKDESLLKRVQKKQDTLRAKIQSGVEGVLPTLSREDVEFDRKAAVMSQKRQAPIRTLWVAVTSVSRVAGVVLIWYFWLLRNG